MPKRKRKNKQSDFTTVCLLFPVNIGIAILGFGIFIYLTKVMGFTNDTPTIPFYFIPFFLLVGLIWIVLIFKYPYRAILWGLFIGTLLVIWSNSSYVPTIETHCEGYTKFYQIFGKCIGY